MLLNFDTSSVVAEFSHLAVCGWTVASPSLRPRRFPRGTRRRRDVHETLLSILILVQLCVNHHQSRRRLRRDWPPKPASHTIPRKSHFQAGNSFQIDARTHGTTDQAHGARVTGAGGERRVLRDRPATHGWHAGPGETPSQPSALTSGIVFGTLEVAAMVLLANMAAVTLAFFAARGAGRAAAENIIAADIIDTESTGNAFQRKWSEFKTRRDGQVRFGQSRELAAQHQRRWWWRRLRRRRIYSAHPHSARPSVLARL